ncbi:DsbE family thiol:disulfide interchange protein [Palleronia sediminis]|uniref:DsbE family thiol:disulfide interchange protein n=1 Tax=Palleronia sediminis TaxID=2547833 RepID=A0A4R6AIC9_9RHOB|nr:DsbE family thiol:disulfide interchange protein [Palleronia sediminis]TDL83700.1 DsbE family thiol:disulfide interchange protein [Palleronia sediminis]
MSRTPWLAILPPAMFAGLAILFYAGMQRDDPDALPSTLVGRLAPALDLAPLGDLPLPDAAALSDGGVTLVNFWASWCAPCRVEHPFLEGLAAREGVDIVGVNYKDAPANALGFLEELGNPYVATGADAQGRVARDWGVYGVPETFVIDGDGIVVARVAGPVTQRTIDSTVAPAIAAARDTANP